MAVPFRHRAVAFGLLMGIAFSVNGADFDHENKQRNPNVHRSMSDIQILRSMAERLCSVATGTEAEIRSALAMQMEPAPLGAREIEVSGGVLSRASVEIRFSPPVLTRADLDSVFGQAEALPRTGPGAAHVLFYDLRVAGKPARVSVFARFREPPKPTSGTTGILLRIDPA